MKNRKNRRTRQVFAGILTAALLFSTAFGQAAMAEGEPVQSEPMSSVEPGTEPTTEPNTAVMDVQNLINALPTVETLAAMSAEEQQAAREKLDSVQQAYMALSDEQKAQVTGTEVFDGLYGFFNNKPDEEPSADDEYVIEEAENPGAENGEATCICEIVCTADIVNTDCPICRLDITQCIGMAPQANSVLLDTAVEDVQMRIVELPTVEELTSMSLEEQQAVYERLQAAYDAYNALTEEQKAGITGTEIFEALFTVFNGMVNVLADMAPGGEIDSNTDESNIQTIFGGADKVAVSGGTITLRADVTVSKSVQFIGGSWTLDLGGYTLTGTGVSEFDTLMIFGNVALTVQNGTLSGGNDSGHALSIVSNSNTVKIGQSMTLIGGNSEVGTGGYGLSCGMGVVEISAGTSITGGNGALRGGRGLSCVDGSIVKILGPITVTGGTDSNGIAADAQYTTDSVVFENNNWTVYGDVSPVADLAIGAGTTLEIPAGTNLMIPDGKTLTNSGTITVAGTLTIPAGAIITNNGTIIVEGRLDGQGSLNGNKANYVQPSAPEQSAVTENSITIGAVAGQNYICTSTATTPGIGDGGWQNADSASLTFGNLTVGIYYLWTFRPGNDFVNDSPVSKALEVRIIPEKPAVAEVKINYEAETISFDDSRLEVNTKKDFTGDDIAKEGSITNVITENESAVYVRMKADSTTPASEATAVTIPARPAAPAPDIIQIQRTPSSLIIFYNGTEALEYRIKANEENFQPWQDSTSFEGLRSTDIYTIETRKKATDSAFCSFSDIWSDLRTSDPAYEITIPKTVTVGEADNDIKINSEKNFWLGTGGQVDVKVKSGLNGDGTLALVRENDPSTTISSQMLVNGQKFTDLTKSVAVFKVPNDPAVAIGFESPTSTENIPAGTYTGTVTFEVSYSEP